MSGPHTLAETERTAEARIAGLHVDNEAMSVISNLFRAANSVRNFMESEVLAKVDLTWTAFVVLWISWIWGSAETRMIAEESGVSKATLSGVLNTLEKRNLVTRKRSAEDGRLVLVTLTPAGKRMITQVFPQINEAETAAVALLGVRERTQAAECLRKLVLATSPAPEALD